MNGVDLFAEPRRCGRTACYSWEGREDLVVTCSDLDTAAWTGLLLSLPRVVWVWLDGDRGSMRPEPVQLVLPDGGEVMREPRFVDPFEADGCRPIESVANEILRSPAPSDRTLPVADRRHPILGFSV